MVWLCMIVPCSSLTYLAHRLICFPVIVGRRPLYLFFFFNDPAPPEISTLPLHAPLPICQARTRGVHYQQPARGAPGGWVTNDVGDHDLGAVRLPGGVPGGGSRAEPCDVAAVRVHRGKLVRPRVPSGGERDARAVRLPGRQGVLPRVARQPGEPRAVRVDDADIAVAAVNDAGERQPAAVRRPGGLGHGLGRVGEEGRDTGVRGGAHDIHAAATTAGAGKRG